MRLPPRSIRALAAVLVAGAAALSGCGSGSGSGDEPKTTAGGKSPQAGRKATYPAAGISFTVPVGWSVAEGPPPLVSAVRTGQATVAIWRYPRTDRLPATRAQLEVARTELLRAMRAADASFEEIKSAATKIAGRPAVQIRARETVDGQRRVVRVTHIYHAGAEVIVDASALPDSFRGVDAQIFRPLLRSLSVVKPAGGG